MIKVLTYLEAKTSSDDENELQSIVSLPTQKLDDKTKTQVIDYLLNTAFYHWRMMGEHTYDIDAFTGETMQSQGIGMNDGLYRWQDNLPFYVRDYDIKIPDDFIEHVKNFYNTGGQIKELMYDWRKC